MGMLSICLSNPAVNLPDLLLAETLQMALVAVRTSQHQESRRQEMDQAMDALAEMLTDDYKADPSDDEGEGKSEDDSDQDGENVNKADGSERDVDDLD